MRTLLVGILVVVAVATAPAAGEIRDILSSAEIDAMFARTDGELVVHETPVYSVVFKVIEGDVSLPRMNRHADEIWFVRSGRARLVLGESPRNRESGPSGNLEGPAASGARRYEIGAGDIVNLPRNTAFRVTAGDGRLAYATVRVFPETAHSDRNLPEPAPMPDVVRSAIRNAVFAENDSNQPLHSVRNLNVNYVIYKGSPGPWESHRGCVDIYFVHTGSGIAHLGGQITDPVEEAPGEIRGTGVSGARTYRIEGGDMVLIPYRTAHHMVPTAEKLGYNLVKVWAHAPKVP